MTNKYLEKLAADYSLQKEAGNAYKNFLASKGKDVSGISNSSLVAAIKTPKKPQGFNGFKAMTDRASRPGVMPSAKMSIATRAKALAGRGVPLSNTVNHGFKGQVRAATGMGLGLSPGAATLKKNLAQSGQTLQSALQSHVAAKQAAPAAAAGGLAGTAKGYLNKAIGFAKAHPKGLALGAAGAVGGLALASRMGKSQEPQYPGMY